MILIVGLGNPGDKYKNNRHNIGYMAIDQMIGSLNASDISKSKFQGKLYKSKDILLLKPTTYMNLSGQSVRAVSDYYDPKKIIVIHDDLDLPFGSVRFKNSGSSGGHNGLKSIDAHIGNDYDRIRLGIGRANKDIDAARYVLGDFSKEESKCVQTIIYRASKAALELCESDIKEVISLFSSKKSICDEDIL